MIYDTFNIEVYRFADEFLNTFSGKGSPKILDVGCSTGILGRRLKEGHKAGVYGIEIDKDAARVAKESYDEVYVMDLEDVFRGNESLGSLVGANQFELIIFGDVLEHTTSPSRILSECKKLLRPGGHIVVSLPNIANLRIRLNLLLGKFNYTGGILDPTHLRFFTMLTSRELIRQSGYEVVSHRNNNSRKIFRALGRVYPKLFALEFVFLCRPRN